MKNSTGWWLLFIVVIAFGPSGRVGAETIPSIGGGTAVPLIDRSTSFDALNVDGLPLTDFQDGGLFVMTEGDSYVGTGFPVFDPFHGASNGDRAFYFPFTNGGGNNSWVTIQTTDAKKIYGLEFMYGNGWTTGGGPYPWGNHDAVLEWQTWNGATLASSGILGTSPLLEMGTIIGFSDIAGFDRILMRCTIATSGDPTLQAIALDSLRVALSYVLDVAMDRVPPAGIVLLPVAPNPTTGIAKIAFELPTPGPVQVGVYDLSGRVVRGLLDEVRPAGAGAVRWDGLDDAGRHVHGGVYFARVTARGLSATRRFALVR